MRRAALTVTALSLALLALAAAPAAQFRSGTNLVELGAVVIDHEGLPVPDLRAGDFEIIEDGRRIPVSTFAAIDADNPATVDDGRFLVLLVEARNPSAKKLARDLVARMGERDVVAIVGIDGSKATTTDQPRVALEQLDALRTPVVGRRPAPRSRIGDSPSTACVECGTGANPMLAYAGAQSWPGMEIGGPMQPSGPGSSNSYAVKALAQMETLADQLKQVPHRRKSIVYIGPGTRLNLTTRAIQDGDSGHWFDVLKHASRANVSISVVSTDGLTGHSYAGARILADETGGEAIVDTNTPGPGIDRLWRRAGQYYLLGYTPGTEKKKRHSVEVRVTRPDLKDVEVRALKARG